jgi:uncharacterized membrane protein YeaQ/YmgE (transglycosylase-associated protein family)
MNIVLLIIFGAIVGWLSHLIIPRPGKQGLLWNIIIGILGSVLGGLIMTLLGFAGITGFNLYSLLVGLLGSIILVSLARLIPH